MDIVRCVPDGHKHDGKFPACKVTHRAIFDVDFSAENFQPLLSPYKIGDADLSQPAF